MNIVHKFIRMQLREPTFTAFLNEQNQLELLTDEPIEARDAILAFCKHLGLRVTTDPTGLGLSPDHEDTDKLVQKELDFPEGEPVTDIDGPSEGEGPTQGQ